MTIRTTDTLDEGRVIFREPETGDRESNESNSEGQVTDPVCGMDVDRNRASVERFGHDGTTYYFCSRDCKEKFERNPEQFITEI